MRFLKFTVSPMYCSLQPLHIYMCSNNFSRVSTKKSTGPGYEIEYFMLQIQRLEGKHCRL